MKLLLLISLLLAGCGEPEPWPELTIRPAPTHAATQAPLRLPTVTPKPTAVLPTRTPTPDIVLTQMFSATLYGDVTIVTPDWSMPITKGGDE